MTSRRTIHWKSMRSDTFRSRGGEKGQAAYQDGRRGEETGKNLQSNQEAKADGEEGARQEAGVEGKKERREEAGGEGGCA